jgi:two-component system response regulator RpfG
LGNHPKPGSSLAAIFAARLRAALDARSVAANDEGRATVLATRLSRTVSTAARWLNGEMLPSLDTLTEIATAYSVSLDYLLGVARHDRALDDGGAHAHTEAPRDPQPVLVVDDQSTARLLLGEVAKGADPLTTPVVMGGAAEALKWASAYQADLVITDYRLPGMDGLEFVKGLRRLSHFADIPVLMVTVVNDRELRHRALQLGINDFLQKPIDTQEGIARCRNLLAMSRQQALLRDRASLLGGLVRARTTQMRERECEAIQLLARVVETANGADANHPARIARVASCVAGELGLPAEEVEAIELGAALHDLGMAAMPGDLTRSAAAPEASHEAHTRLGYQLLKGHEFGPLRTGALIAVGHHECFDGSGFPMGLRGDHIALAARIVAAADRLDCLRVGLPELDWAETWELLQRDRGSRLDPQIVDVLVKLGTDVKRIYEALPVVPVPVSP